MWDRATFVAALGVLCVGMNLAHATPRRTSLSKKDTAKLREAITMLEALEAIRQLSSILTRAGHFVVYFKRRHAEHSATRLRLTGRRWLVMEEETIPETDDTDAVWEERHKCLRVALEDLIAFRTVMPRLGRVGQIKRNVADRLREYIADYVESRLAAARKVVQKAKRRELMAQAGAEKKQVEALIRRLDDYPDGPETAPTRRKTKSKAGPKHTVPGGPSKPTRRVAKGKPVAGPSDGKPPPKKAAASVVTGPRTRKRRKIGSGAGAARPRLVASSRSVVRGRLRDSRTR